MKTNSAPNSCLSSTLLTVFYCLLMSSLGMISMNTLAAAPPSDVPPKMDRLDEGDPAVTNSKSAKSRQTEQVIENGQQREVHVTGPAGTYIVKSNTNVGTSLPGDAQSNASSPAQWVVKSWGGSKSTDKADDDPAVLPPNPNPSKK